MASKQNTIEIENLPVKNLVFADQFVRFNADRDEFQTANQELAENIKEVGLLHPLHVTRMDDGNYMVIAGNRRLLAIKHLKWTSAPCVVMEADPFFVALSENINRFDLTPLEKGEWIARAEEHYSEKFAKSKSPRAAMFSWLGNKLGLSPRRVSELRKTWISTSEEDRARIKAGEVSTTAAAKKAAKARKASGKEKRGGARKSKSPEKLAQQTLNKFSRLVDDIKPVLEFIAKNAEIVNANKVASKKFALLKKLMDTTARYIAG
jgi:ParB/RepB/Spo0J family partition protein